MSYRISGLSPAPFTPLFALDDVALAERGARRVLADSPSGFPCRVSLADAAPGDEMLLIHHVSHDVATPYRSGYAILVGRGAEPATFTDVLPSMIERRRVGLRGFGADGMLRAAALAMAGEATGQVDALLSDPAITYIDVHNAAQGCFLARVERT